MTSTVAQDQQQQQQQHASSSPTLPVETIRAMIDACAVSNLPVIQQLVTEDALYACQQDDATGISPLMAASKGGHLPIAQFLLDQGAPWNAIDRQGQCAGNYATLAEQWEVVNLLVEWGTRSELILGEVQRSQRQQPQGQQQSVNASACSSSSNQLPVEHESSTKPDYLQQRLRYNPDGTALLDADDDAVMMEWERPIMKAHAQILMEAPGKRVMNVGFGMGIIDSFLQEYSPNLHIIIEAHPDVYAQMLASKWDSKPNVKIFHGKWQDVVPQLIQQGVQLDGIYFDTYAEHAFDMEEFHKDMSQLLSKPNGVYSFFNGLAPDNLFFHGVGKCCYY
jgi:protein arginine N-methyltransferase 2